jgi:hypothetical protein
MSIRRKSMKPRLIIMLTHHDKTVSNAIEVFNECKDLPVKCWGFKDVGLKNDKMKELVSLMKSAGKETFLEVVSYTEDECMAGAKIAVEYGFDYLMGTIFYEKVYSYLSSKNIKYLPFCGKVSSSPSILEGTIDEIILHAGELLGKGLYGIDLLAFRHLEGKKLAKDYCGRINEPVVIAGSINSKSLLDFMTQINPWGFTMGSALFENIFVKNGNFKENLVEVLNYLDGKNK